jgi:hypothetical protein
MKTILLCLAVSAIGLMGADEMKPPPAQRQNLTPPPPPSGSPRSTQGCTVSYSKYLDERARPQLPVRLNYGLQAMSTVALVDSGADDSVFPLSDARRLGIDLSDLPVTETAGVGNEHNLTYHAIVTVTVTFCGHQYSYPSSVAFISGNSSLLGQAGFLDHFRVTFDRAKKEFEIRSKDIQPDVAATGVSDAGSPGEGPTLRETLNWLREKIPLAISNLTVVKEDSSVKLAASRQGTVWSLDGCSSVIGETFTYMITWRNGSQRQTWKKAQFALPLGAIISGHVGPRNLVPSEYRFSVGQRQDYGVFLSVGSHEAVYTISEPEVAPEIGSKNNFDIGFPDEAMAQRVLRAFLRAADLCRTKEPF